VEASANCIAILDECEGLRLTPYLDVAGVPTIGYGTTKYPDGRRVTLQDPPITKEQADQFVLQELNRDYVPDVNHYLQVPVNQNQFDALVDFAYNVGTEALRTSTLLKLLNTGNFGAAAQQFGLWVHAGGHVLPGLIKRRELERKLFEGEL
jgi:lysozyme